VNEYTVLLLWVLVVGTAFAVAWRKGWWLRLANYIQGTQEELKKCSWPTLDELQGSTVVVMVSVLLLGVFTVIVDLILTILVRWMIWV